MPVDVLLILLGVIVAVLVNWVLGLILVVIGGFLLLVPHLRR